ncbi:PAAR domain-containing protein, partial [Photorhabdus kleinii]
MRSVVEGKKIILKGDTTTTGGDVLNGSGLVNQQLSVVCKGDPVFCPACKKIGVIAEDSIPVIFQVASLLAAFTHPGYIVRYAP